MPVRHPELRQADLSMLQYELQWMYARRHDFVLAGENISFDNFDRLVIHSVGDEPLLTEEGVIDGEVYTELIDTAHQTIASALDIPIGYWRRMIADDGQRQDKVTDLAIAAWNGNHWLEKDRSRTFLVRTLLEGNHGICRALLSSRFKIIDNLDVLMATLEGIRAAGLDANDVQIDGDLTMSMMRIRVTAPQIAVNVLDLVENQRGRWGHGMDKPLLFAGLAIANSETGSGALKLNPHATWQICTNGMTRSIDAARHVHLGGRLEEGIVRWSDETQTKSLELLTSKVTDAVRTFLDADYLQAWADTMRVEAELEVKDGITAVQALGKTLKFTESQQNELFNHFIQGGNPTMLGLFQAATSVAYDSPDAEFAALVEEGAWDAALAVVR